MNDGLFGFIMGMIVGGFAGAALGATGIGYVSHFATCPAADRFRRKNNEQ